MKRKCIGILATAAFLGLLCLTACSGKEPAPSSPGSIPDGQSSATITAGSAIGADGAPTAEAPSAPPTSDVSAGQESGTVTVTATEKPDDGVATSFGATTTKGTAKAPATATAGTTAAAATTAIPTTATTAKPLTQEELAGQYVWYTGLSGSQQAEYMTTFPDVPTFVAWYHTAKAAYEALHPDVELEPGATVTLRPGGN